jgi:hypothetical protein
MQDFIIILTPGVRNLRKLEQSSEKTLSGQRFIIPSNPTKEVQQ